MAGGVKKEYRKLEVRIQRQ